MNTGFHCTGQMVDSLYGIVWVSGLLMSTLSIEWPMVVVGLWFGQAVGLWYGQAHVMDNEHRCILLMAFWMHRDTMTRSWGPLLCHTSTTITSHCKDLYTIPGTWKHPSSCMASILSPYMSLIDHVWNALDQLVRQCVPVLANIQQLHTAIEEEWTNIPQTTINNLINSMRRKWWSHQIPTGFRTPPDSPNTIKLQILEWPFIVASLRHTCTIIMLSNQHLDIPVRWMDYLGEVLTNTDLDRFVNNIWEK